MSTIDFNRVRLFVRVAEVGSFTGNAALRDAARLLTPVARSS
jgi:hypothetical protein